MVDYDKKTGGSFTAKVSFKYGVRKDSLDLVGIVVICNNSKLSNKTPSHQHFVDIFPESTKRKATLQHDSDLK